MKRFLIGINLLFLILYFFPAKAHCLNPNTSLDRYIHHVWTTQDMLPQNTIYSICQDKTGYLWLGTDRGVVRYDGTNFKVLNKMNVPAIKNNSFTTLHISPDGSIWMGTYGGGIIHFKAGEFKNFSNQEGLQNHFINSIAEDHQKNLWFGTTGDGIIHLKNNQFTSIIDKDGLSNNIVTCLLVDGRGKLWAGTEKGLNCITPKKIKTYSISNGLPGNNVNTIFEDAKGFLWVGTNNGIGVIKNRPRSLLEKKFIKITQNEGLTNNFINWIINDKNGNIWIATNKGLNRINANSLNDRLPNPNLLKIDSFTSADGLSDDSVLTLFEDQWGNLWVGTSGGGLNVFREGEFGFLSEKDGLTSGYIKAIYEDSNQTIWIGTHGGGLNRYKDQKFTAYKKKDGLSSNYIESLCGDHSGNLWIGTINGLIHFKDNKFHVYSTKDGLSHPSIRSLYEDKKSNLWIGTYGGGLYCYKNKKFKSFDTQKGLTNNFVITLSEDSYGNLWIGTNKGINCFDSYFFRYFGEQPEIPKGRIFDIYCDTTGTIWIASSDDGLTRYRKGIFTPIKNKRELQDYLIYNILEDHQGNFWLSTAKGIISVSRRRLNWYMDGKINFIDWHYFQEADGLITSVCSGGFQPAGCKTSQNHLWFPTIKGIAIMDLSKPRFKLQKRTGLPDIIDKLPNNYDHSPKYSYLTVNHEIPVIIEKIVADNNEYKAQEYTQLDANTERIEFHFSAINYSSPEKVLYKYRLKGYDEKWIRSTNRKSIVYSDIPPGNYEFEVMARLSDGNWNPTGDSWSITIMPHFYQTFWFYLLLTGSLTLAAWGIPRLFESIKQKNIREKYKNSPIPLKKSKTHLTQLIKMMEKQKPFLNPNLSLQDLAKELSMTKEDLSQIINKYMKCNFKNFINKYRIEEAKKKLEDPKENKFVIMKIALDVGFNSKSVFNSSFKKFTGISPSEYRKKNQKNK